MAKFTPYIFTEDAKSQAEFYIHALGGEIASIMTHGQVPGTKEEHKDKVMHLCVIAAGVPFFMCDWLSGPLNRGNDISLNLEFDSEEEGRAAFNKLAEGGRINHPFQAEFWGAMFGQVQDKFGVNWMITHEPKRSE